jgi:DNA anti-recombination protein RmuC
MELYNRVVTLTEHIAKVRNGLHSTVENLNKAVGSYETRIRPQAETLRKLGIAGEKLESIPEANPDVRRIEGTSE